MVDYKVKVSVSRLMVILDKVVYVDALMKEVKMGMGRMRVIFLKEGK